MLLSKHKETRGRHDARPWHTYCAQKYLDLGLQFRVGFGGERAELELLPKGANALAPAEIPYLLT